MTTLKDPVHGYIEVNDLERRVIDTPWFQRLKQVRQNDVSSTVYPTMHTRRFEHSLGAMHVAGKCVASALEGSNQAHRDRFLNALWNDLHPGQAFNDTAARKASKQIARLYGALHDVGHPPFSHLLERAIPFARIYPARGDIVGEKAKKWHELNGVDIVRTKIAPAVTADPEETLYLNTAARLLLGQDLTPSLRGLQSLVDAVIDTDRMDFVARDGRASGAEFGVYDLTRLVDSFRIVIDESNGAISKVHIRPSLKALSAVESLLLERHKLYRWVFFHHRVMLAKALTRVVVEWLSAGLRDQRLEPTDYQADNYYTQSPDRDYVLLGDNYVEQKLWRAFKALAAPANDVEARALSALRILLLRDRLAIALWKDRDEYEDFERRLSARFRVITSPPDGDAIERKHGTYANWIGDYVAKLGDPARGFFEKVSQRLLANGTGWFLLEATEGFSTKGKDELINASGTQAVALAQFSTVVRGVVESWRRDIHLYAFWVALRNDAVVRTSAVRENCRDRLAEAIVATFSSDETEQNNLRGFLENG